MIDTIKLMEWSSDILDICYNQDDFTTSDLQGVIEAKVMLIYQAGYKEGRQNENIQKA